MWPSAGEAPTRRYLIAALIVAGAGVTSRASALQATAAAPATLTLDRMDAGTRLGVQVGFDKVDRVKLSDGFLMRYELHGQAILPNRLAGLYGQLPFSHLFDFNAADATALSNLDVGVFLLPRHNSDLILRVGLALPTGSENLERVLTNIATSYERLTDFLLSAPNYTILRLSVSTVQDSPTIFFRADLGFDVVLDQPTNPGAPSAYLRANGAAGVHLGGADLSLELVNFGSLNGTNQGDLGRRFMHTLAVGVSTHGPDQFRAGTVFPLDENQRGKLWIISLGYQHVTH